MIIKSDKGRFSFIWQMLYMPVISDVLNRLAFHRQVMRNDKFRSGKFDTSFLDTFQFQTQE